MGTTHIDTHPVAPGRRAGHGASLFVHDFVAVPRPVEHVLDRVGRQLRNDLLAELILASWRADAEEFHRAGAVGSLPALPDRVEVELGVPRFRPDAVVVPLRWKAAPPGWLPHVDADLEIASFGRSRTHVHLLGRYELPAGVGRQSSDASLVQRLAVALVRQVLSSLSQACDRPPSDHEGR